jgi:hypothetical protein
MIILLHKMVILIVSFIFSIVPILLYYQSAYSLENPCTVRNIKEQLDYNASGNLAYHKNASKLQSDNLSQFVGGVEIHREVELLGTINATEANSEKNKNSSEGFGSPNIKINGVLPQTPIKLWKGLNIFSAADCIKMRPTNPPDVTLGVSKNHVAQMVHNSIQVWDKTGKLILKESLHDFFNISRMNYITDPVILFDNSSDNWYSIIVDGGNESRDPKSGLTGWSCNPICKVVIVKSNNDNPTQNRSIIEINATEKNFFPDEPKIAVNKFNLFMTTSEFNITSGAENHFYTYMIDKEFRNVFEGRAYVFLPLWSDQHFAVPERNPSNCTSTAALVKDNPRELYSSASSIVLYNFCDNRSVGSPYGAYNVYLPATSKLMPAVSLIPLINESDLKISSAMRDNESTWLALHAACKPTEISNTSCVRIIKLNYVPAEDEYNLAADIQFHINNTDLYYPAVGVSKDRKVYFVYGFSNSSIFPSLGISKVVSENQIEIKYRIFGSYINNSTRYGDYFSGAIDPIDGSVWLSGEYVDGSLANPVPQQFNDRPHMREQTWSTYIANVH